MSFQGRIALLPVILINVFAKRSKKLERIDTGDYTAAEYDLFLHEIKFINSVTGDLKALQNTLLPDIRGNKLTQFSVLDVGAGSGEMLRAVANFAKDAGLKCTLTGLELHKRSAEAILQDSAGFPEINAVRSNALMLPFADNTFDYSICSLFTHHLRNEDVVNVISEMNRVSRRGIFVTDLHRHPLAYVFYTVFCLVFRISPLVREDGLLSILRSFKPEELRELGEQAGIKNASIKRSFPFRLVLTAPQI